MHQASNPQGMPTPDPEKAPYGHADARPLSSAFAETETSPAVSVTDEQMKSAAEALPSLADGDVPVFPPANVSTADAEGPYRLPISWTAATESPPTRETQDIAPARSFVIARPWLSTLAVAALGAMFVRILFVRASRRW